MDKFNKCKDNISQEMIEELHANVLRYGVVISDIQSEENGNYYRIRMINYNDIIYVDWMRNGVVIFCEPISGKRIDTSKVMPQREKEDNK